MNLIDNAVKYTVSGDEVESAPRPTTASCGSSVADNGPGIHREEQASSSRSSGASGSTGEPGRRPGAVHRAVDRRGARRHARGLVGARRGRDVHDQAAYALRAKPADAEVGGERTGAVRDPLSQVGRPEQHSLATRGEQLADQPVLGSERLLGHGRAVGQELRALLDLPARDRGRVPDADGSRIRELVRIETLARPERGAARGAPS